MDTEDRPNPVGDDMNEDRASLSSLLAGDPPATDGALPLPQVDKLEVNAQVKDQVRAPPTEESHQHPMCHDRALTACCAG
eukprot:1723017-Prymnesium_polylepis.1